MSAPSLSDLSIAGSTGGVARKLNMTAAKPNMSIQLDNHYKSKVYTSSSTVSGHLLVSSQRDVQFDSVQILLLGTTKTRVDGVNIPQATSHTFLKLNMPIPEDSYPVPRVLDANRSLKIPFNFVIPSHLTINACNHRVANNPVVDFHTRLPPSVGSWERDDFAPDMSAVEYVIKTRVLRQGFDDVQPIRLAELVKEINVLPATPEDPPLNITSNDKMYTMTKSKTMRKNILSSKTGKVTASAAQPGAFMLNPDGRSGTPTTAQINLEFEPLTAEAQPPKIASVSAKLAAITYFSSGGVKSFPNMGDWSRNFGADGRGSYAGTVTLPTSATQKSAWEKRPITQARRDSGYCSELAASDSDHSQQQKKSSKKNSKSATPPAHTFNSTVQVPIQLPTEKKMYLPTFHSCITSRVYLLSLSVAFSAGGINSTVTLAVPLQVGVDALVGSPADDEGLPSFETAVQEAEVDAMLRPRLLSVPDVEFASSLPGYGELPDARAAAAAVAAH